MFSIDKKVLNAIGAAKINLSDIDSDGTVNYSDSYKTGVTGQLDSVMKSIRTIKADATGFSGVCERGTYRVDFMARKVRGLLGRSNKMKPRGSQTRAMVPAVYLGKRKDIMAGTLIACLNLLSEGYYLDDWCAVAANHMDNSGGAWTLDAGVGENLHPSNLELYRLQCSKLNTIHGLVFNDIYRKTGIQTSFSVYDMAFISHYYNSLVDYKSPEDFEEKIINYPHTFVCGRMVIK